ncbi:VPLPA-CTERM sorting domain-containing protein [Roseibium sp. HPY-6]|uniref:VPLPA-CTERM sorting domain-containing protein n=1 Tax=Roseibium sp. HPY-6 TaxID=3229852 RepID=UPI00338F4CCE
MFRILAFSLFLCLSAVSANSAVITYEYVGRTMVEVDRFGRLDPTSTFQAQGGILKLDEAALPNGTLVNTTVDFTFIGGDTTTVYPGLVQYTVLPRYPELFGRIRIQTNKNMDIVRWSLVYSGDPGVATISFDRDFVSPYGRTTYVAHRGYWLRDGEMGPISAIVPLPAALPMLACGLLALGFMSRRLKITQPAT